MVLSPIIKKLMFVRQFDIDKGKIELLGGRQIMIHASAVLELQEIDEGKVYESAKQSSLKNIKGAVEHAQVYGKMRDVFMDEIASLGKKIGETDSGVINTLQEIFNVYGLGEINIQELDNAGKKAIVIVRDSALVEEFTKKTKGRSKAPVCSLTAGVIAGMFSYIFGKEIDCIEEKCKSQGNSYCLFRVG